MADKSFWHDKKDRVWLQNFWYYYKFVILGVVIAAAVVIAMVVNIVNQVQYDLTVYYMGNYTLSRELFERTERAFEQLIDDADGKDGIHLSYEDLTQVDNPQDEMAISMRQVVMVKVAEGEGYLYILTQTQFENYAKEGIFEDISDIINADGPVYGICLNNNAFMRDLGYNDDANLWMAVRVLHHSRQDQQNINMQNNAKKVLRHLYFAGENQ